MLWDLMVLRETKDPSMSVGGGGMAEFSRGSGSLQVGGIRGSFCERDCFASFGDLVPRGRGLYRCRGKGDSVRARSMLGGLRGLSEGREVVDPGVKGGSGGGDHRDAWGKTGQDLVGAVLRGVRDGHRCSRTDRGDDTVSVPSGPSVRLERLGWLMGNISRGGNEEEAASSTAEGATDGVGNEEAFFVGRRFIADTSRFASVRLDGAPLSHGDHSGPPMYGFVWEGG